MTRDDIIRMASEGGLPLKWISENGVIQWGQLERFAALVAAAEREACAKVAEKMLRFYTQAVTGVPEAIRERGS